MTVPSYVNGGVAAESASATSRAPARPASLVNGNLLLAFCIVHNSATISVSGTGWTLFNPTPGTTDVGKVLAYCIVTGTETDPTFSWTGAAACRAKVLQYTGNRNAQPPFGASRMNSGASGTTHSVLGITTTHADSLGIYIHIQNSNTASNTPTNFIEDSDTLGNTSLDGCAAGHKDMPSPGTTDNISIGAVSVSWLFWQIEIIPPNVAPVITSDGGGATAAVSVTAGNTAVTTVTATDTDTSDTLTYSISGGADQALFSIVGATGVLTFSAPQPAGSYVVIVQVSDGDLTDTQTITVTVAAAAGGPSLRLDQKFNIRIG